MMKNVQGEEYQTPRQTADQLGISPQTLRAYSGLVEKVTQRADFFHRDQNNGRLYSAQNLADLKRVNAIKKEHNKTLNDAIREVFDQQIIKDKQADDMPTPDTAADKANATQAVVAAQNNQQVASNDGLAPILYTLKQLSDQNNDVIDQIKKMQAQLDETNDKYAQLVKALENQKKADQATKTSVDKAATAEVKPETQGNTPTDTTSDNAYHGHVAPALTDANQQKKGGFFSRLFGRH